MSSHAIHPFRVVSPDRRLAGIAVTLLLHLLLLLCWTMARQAPLPDTGARSAMQWIDLPPLPAAVKKTVPSPRAPAPVATPARRQATSAPTQAPIAPPAMTLAPSAPPSVDPAAPPPTQAPAPAAADTIMERARRSAGAADRAVRKENRPYIVAPLDSPQIRLSNGMARAHDMAPPKLWEAPKVEELVNQTGDGVRRTRVITGNLTYCISERATNTSIDTIERHGKLRLTNCPQHEDTATQQTWRTARD